MDDKRLVEVPVRKEQIFAGNILNVQLWTVKLPDGSTATRELILHKGAAAVVALDGKGNVAMVRQYRAALGRVLLEIPAGKLDSVDEDPLLCAKRELREETGLVATDYKKLTTLDVAAGYSSEIIHIYLATGLSQGEAQLDEDEFLDFAWMPVEDVINGIYNGDICDSKTIAGILLAVKEK